MLLLNRSPLVLVCLTVLGTMGFVVCTPVGTASAQIQIEEEAEDDTIQAEILESIRRDQAIARVSQKLENRSELQVNRLARICQLTEAQRGSIETETRKALSKVTKQARNAVRSAISVDRSGNELATIQRKHNHLLVEELGEIVQRLADDNVLSAEQARRYLDDRTSKQTFRKKTLELATLASIDLRVPLTPSQRDEVQQLIEDTIDAEELEFNPVELPYTGGVVHLLSMDSMSSILSPTQIEIYTKWKTTKTPYLYRSAKATLPDSAVLESERLKFMSATIDLLKSVLTLEENQIRRLTTASKGEVKRIVETEIELHRRWQKDQLEIDDATYDLLSGDAQVPLLNGKFWNRALERVLSDEQRERFERFQKGRSKFHVEANLRILALVMMNDESLALQGKHLVPILEHLIQKAGAPQILGFTNELQATLSQEDLQEVIDAKRTK